MRYDAAIHHWFSRMTEFRRLAARERFSSIHGMPPSLLE